MSLEKNLDSVSHVKDESVSTYKQINVIFSLLGADYPCLTSFHTSGD